jgi:hypothetical protein
MKNRFIQYSGISIVILALFIIAPILSCFGVPAMPFVIEIKQPDGSAFNAQKKGDEWFNWTETIDNKVIVHNKANGFFEYGEIKTVDGEERLAPSGLKVRAEDFNRPLAAPNFKPVTRDQLNRLRQKALQKRKQGY